MPAQEDLKEKVKSLHAMKAELDMRHAQVDDYKFSIKQMQVMSLSREDFGAAMPIGMVLR